MTIDLEAQAEALRSLQRNVPNDTARLAVAEAMGSKFEGIRSLAAQVLGSWGDRESLDELKSAYAEAQGLEYGWALRGVLAREIGRGATPEDADWILDRFFEGDGLVRSQFSSALQALPWSKIAARVEAELEHSDPYHRTGALLAIVRCSPPGASEYFAAMAEDPDEGVRRIARFQMSQ